MQLGKPKLITSTTQFLMGFSPAMGSALSERRVLPSCIFTLGFQRIFTLGFRRIFTLGQCLALTQTKTGVGIVKGTETGAVGL